MPKHIIVGTAGHIDHGKTALVLKLTGIDTDRLAEEKRRGITIDIGFAHLELGSDLQLGFVDVPGHERFVKNMLAGVAGIDLVMLIVAADEGIMPQTREHFDICELLNIRKGLVALTKIDLVEQEIRELVELEIEEYLGGSFLDGAPIVPVSSATGEGLDQLREALGQVAATIEPKSSRHRFRLPIDRAFAMKGFGTVVTGTMVSGRLAVNSEVEVYPLGCKARVRGIEVHNQTSQQAVAGQRTAVNLSGVDTHQLRRGMVLAPPGLFRPTDRIDCALELLPSAKPLKYGAPIHFHAGTAESVARAYLLGGATALKPGTRSFARIRLRDPLLLLPEDRFIVRQFSPLITIGGGQVLDSLPPVRRLSNGGGDRLEAFESGSAERVLEVLVQEVPYGTGRVDIVARTGWLDEELDEVAQVLETERRVVRVQEDPLWLVHREAFDKARAQSMAFLERFHQQNPLLPGASKEALRSGEFSGSPSFYLDCLLAELERDRKVVVEDELVRLARHKIVLREEEREAREKIISAFREAGLTVPGLSDLLSKLPIDRSRADKILRVLVRDRVLVRVGDNLVFHRDAIEQVKQWLREEKAQSDTIGVPRFKELTGVSRKYAIPLLEYLDREKITRRVREGRVIL